MNEDINIELRKNVLANALRLEAATKDLIKSILQVSQQKLKSLGNKTSSLSFKNKIDLLYDLDILNDDEYKSLLLFMEFRNQFVHNIECKYFTDAISFLGIDKKKKLLKFDELVNELDEEIKLRFAYDNLFLKCLDIIINKRQEQLDRIKTIGKPFKDLAQYSKFLVEFDGSILLKILDSCSKINEDDNNDLKLFKIEIGNLIANHDQKLKANEKFIKFNKQLEEVNIKTVNRIIRNNKNYYS